MSVADDERAIQRLEQEKAAFESRPHSGYADASHVRGLDSEIEAIRNRIAREKQRAEHGQG